MGSGGESEDEQGDAGAVARLDAARAELVGQLADAAPGSVVTSKLEQFLPAVMAVLPLVRAGMRVLGGREKLAVMIAKPVAELIKGHVGPEATRALSRASLTRTCSCSGWRRKPRTAGSGPRR